MANTVYDPEDKKQDLNSLTPDELSKLEHKYSTGDDQAEDYIRSKNLFGERGEQIADQEGRGGMGKKLREHGEEAIAAEDEALNARVQDLFKDDPPDSENRRNRLFGRGSTRRRIGLAAAGIGIPALAAGFLLIPNLLGLFKLQNFFENINTATFSRLNAQFDNRSDRWLKSYIQLRLTEIDGDVDPGRDTLYFRANRIDTDNPIRDWYHTMRTSSFEADLAKNGIVFTSTTTKNPDGSIRLGFADIRINDVSATGRIDLGDGTNIDLSSNQGREDLLSRLNDSNISGNIDVVIRDGPGSNKEARRIIKKAVNDNTRGWQVFKRRQVRQGIQNMTGVSSWRLFETTRDKIDARKLSIQRKIMDAVLPEGRTGTFIKCLFGAGDCPGTTDPASADSRNAGATSDASRASADDTPTEEIGQDGSNTRGEDANGNPVNNTTGEYSPGSVSGEVGDNVGSAVGEEAAEDATKQTFIKKLISDFIGNPYTKIWSYLKKLAKLHETLSENKLGKLVVQGKRSQYMTAFAMMGVATSQMKSGDIQNTELLDLPESEQAAILGFADTVDVGVSNGQINQYMSFFENAERSEAWILYGGNEAPEGTASALAANDQGRAAYCDMSDSEKKQQPVYYKCSGDGIGDGGAAEEWSEAYNNSAGKILGPIADAVNSVNNSIFGNVINVFSSVSDTLVNNTVGPVIEKILDASGGTDLIQDAVTAGVTKAMEYSGAGVKYVPGAAGELNYQLMGAAASAEASARYNGAAATSSFAYLKDYTSEMATNWQSEQDENQSTWERYASLSNPKSFASSALMTLSGSSPKSILNSLSDPLDTFNNYASAFNGNSAHAATNEVYAATEWSEVDTYDFPKECMDLDPLDPDYLQKATNAPAEVPRTYALLQDAIGFWDAVYGALPGSPSEKEAAAASVYNCALFDQSVRGGIGYVYGYDKDGGLDSGNTASTTTTPDTGGQLRAGVDIEGQNTDHIPCPVSPTVTDLGLEPEAYKSGVRYTIRLCNVHGVRLNSIVAKDYDDMFTAMKAAGYDIRGSAGFRDMKSQEQGWAGGAGAGTYARPGYSNHQFGVAVDISCSGGGTSYTQGTGRHRAAFLESVAEYPCLNWVHLNSFNYGLLLQCDGKSSNGGEIRGDSGGCEWWHISPTGG